MKILNLGSCCIDHVYHVDHFVNPGETLPCVRYEVHPGGKGLNQSVAIAKAGGNVLHAGCIGTDGTWLKDVLGDAGVDTSLLKVMNEATGHANIQVNASGENAIVLFGGTNRLITPADVDHWINQCDAGDYLVLQNETSELETAMRLAADKGLRVIFNAAPMTESVLSAPLEMLELLLINETEGAALSGKDASAPDDILAALKSRYPDTGIVLTLGAAGAVYSGPAGRFEVSSPQVEAVDTTGAGDTFTGYFVADYAAGADVPQAMQNACSAAALSVTRAGAASGIPTRKEANAAAH